MNISTKLGEITIANEVIADIVGLATIECAGVVGMASQKKLKDGVSELLKRENYSKGIIIHSEEKSIRIDLHVVVLYGVKISEIATNIQEKVKYNLQELVGLNVDAINIFIEDVKVDA